MKLFWPILIGAAALSVQTVQAESRTELAISSQPPYRVNGALASVIIPTFNEEKYLPDLLAALSHQTYSDLEVIVVDNLSTDRTVELARSAGARVEENTEYNIGKSRNIGAHASSGGVLVFIDADTIPEHNLIERFVQEIEGGAALVYSNKCATDDRLFSLVRILMGHVLPYPSAQCFAVSRDVFYAAKGYNENCLPQENCSEEKEFANRVMAMGTTKYLRFNYAAISSRRIKAQGLFPSSIWEDRTYREQIANYGR